MKLILISWRARSSKRLRPQFAMMGITLIEVLLVILIMSLLLVATMLVIDHYRKEAIFDRELKEDIGDFNDLMNAAKHYFNICYPGHNNVSVDFLINPDNHWSNITDYTYDPKHQRYTLNFKHLANINSFTAVAAPTGIGQNLSISGAINNADSKLSTSQIKAYQRALGVPQNPGTLTFTMTRYVDNPTYQGNDYSLGYELNQYGTPTGNNPRC